MSGGADDPRCHLVIVLGRVVEVVAALAVAVGVRRLFGISLARSVTDNLGICREPADGVPSRGGHLLEKPHVVWAFLRMA